MQETLFGRVAATICLVFIAGCALSGCGSKNANAPGNATPGSTSTGSAPSGSNPVGDAYRDGIVAAHKAH